MKTKNQIENIANEASELSRELCEALIDTLNESEGFAMGCRSDAFIPTNDGKLYISHCLMRSSNYIEDGVNSACVTLMNARGESMSYEFLLDLVKTANNPRTVAFESVPHDLQIKWPRGSFPQSEAASELLAKIPPMMLDKKATRGMEPVCISHTPNSELYRGGGRTVAELNKWLSDLNFRKLTVPEGNSILSRLDDVRSKYVYSVDWNDKPISEEYNSERGSTSEMGSCMSGKPTSYFEMYDELEKQGKLRMIRIKRGGEPAGRALVWFDEGKAYLDRVYLHYVNNSWPTHAINLLKEFIKSEGIENYIYGSSGSVGDGLRHAPTFKIRVDFDPDYFDEVPYVDTMRYFTDGYLRQDSGDIEFCNTDGTHSGYDRVECYHGEIRSECDCVHSDIYNDYVPDDMAVSVRRPCGDTTYVYDDETVDLDSNFYSYPTIAYEDFDELVEHYSGDYIFSQDAVELHDGRYAHKDEDYDEMECGGIALADDTVESDSGIRLASECTEKPDGRYIYQG